MRGGVTQPRRRRSGAGPRCEDCCRPDAARSVTSRGPPESSRAVRRSSSAPPHGVAAERRPTRPASRLDGDTASRPTWDECEGRQSETGPEAARSSSVAAVGVRVVSRRDWPGRPDAMGVSTNYTRTTGTVSSLGPGGREAASPLRRPRAASAARAIRAPDLHPGPAAPARDAAIRARAAGSRGCGSTS